MTLSSAPERSPASAPFTLFDDEFAAVLGDAPRLERVVETDAHEGPAYAADEDALYFTTVPQRAHDRARPQVALGRLALDGTRFPLEPERLSYVRPATNVANGLTLDRDGSLLVCEQGTFAARARIVRVDRSTGAAETVVDAYRGLPLNSPNDVVVARDGSIWFTDPSYGHLQGFRPEPRLVDRVYRYDPGSRRLAVVADGLDKPNGLAFSPDESVLYLGDNGGPHRLLAYDVAAGSRLIAGRVVAELPPEHPDGIVVDGEGRIYASSGSGVRVFAPDGRPLGEIAVPGAVNFTFGGPDLNVLFITADTAVWAAVLNATGS